MTARITTLGLVLALLCAAATGQAPKTNSRLSADIAKKMKDGINTMTAEEALKLIPGDVAMKADAASTMIPGGTADHVLLWSEARRVRITFASGKVTAVEAAFPDAAGKGGVLSPESAGKIKLGMAKDDALKVFKAEKGRFAGSHSTVSLNKGSVEEFSEGRWIKAIIKDGKVVDVQWNL